MRPSGDSAGRPTLRVVVNQAQSNAEAADCLARIAASSRQFLGMVVSPLGFVRSDAHVPLAVRARKPFVTAYPNSLAARGVRRLAETLIEERRPRPPRPGFFASLSARGPGAGGELTVLAGRRPSLQGRDPAGSAAQAGCSGDPITSVTRTLPFSG